MIELLTVFSLGDEMPKYVPKQSNLQPLRTLLTGAFDVDARLDLGGGSVAVRAA